MFHSGHDSIEPPSQRMRDTHAGYGYQAENFNTGGNNDEVKMDHEMDDVPMDNYEEMEVNAPVLPPKPKQNSSSKRPNVNALDSTRYVHGRGQHNLSKPATMSQIRPQFHSRVQQQPQVRSDSPEQIYEVPD